MIENTESKMIFQIGTVNTFAFNVPFRSTDSIRCFLGNPEDGTELELVSGSDFTVEKKDDYSNGATITLLLDPIPSGKTLAIIRELPILQELDLPVAGKLPSNALEIQLDKIIMICQQLAADLERAVKVSVTSTEVSAESLLKNIGIAAASAAEAAASAATQAKNAATSATKAQDAATRIETMDGFLPLKGGTLTGTVDRKFSAITLNVAPTSASYTNFATFRDKNDTNIGVIQLSQYAQASDVLLRIYVKNGDSSEGEKIVLAPGYVDLPATVRLANGIIKTKSVTERMAIYGGTASNNGAYLVLRGKDNSAGGHTPGEFVVATCEIGSETNVLRGGSDGKLTWKNKDITLGYPNYAAGVDKTSSYVAGSGWTATQDGWVFMRTPLGASGSCSIYCNGGLLRTSTEDVTASAFFPVKKGDVVTIRPYKNPSTVNATATPQNLIFYPNR